MNHKTIKINNYNLHLIKEKKFKTITIECVITRKVSKKEVTYSNCLIEMLLCASLKYPTRKMMARKLEELYLPSISGFSSRFGNYLVSRIGLTFLDSKYIDEDILKDCLDYLKEIILNPLVANDSFSSQYLESIKEELINETKGLKEDINMYSNVRLLEEMDNNSPSSITGYSDIDILKKIDGHDLYKYYQNLLKNSQIDFFIVGDIEEKEIVNYFRKNFIFSNNGCDIKDLSIKQKPFIKEKSILENGEYEQSKLAIALKIDNLNDFEYRYVISLYNLILGANTTSILMQKVRENNSLAYYIYSNLSKTDNLIIINSGINSKNYDEVLKLVRESLKDMREGRFTEEDINNCKIKYVELFTNALSSSKGILEIILGETLFNLDSVEERKSKIKKVTKEDIMKVASKITIDTIFFLKGV